MTSGVFKSFHNITLNRCAYIHKEHGMSRPVWFRCLILATSTTMTGFLFGLLLTLGSIFPQMLDKYQESRAVVVTVQAILMGLGYGSGIIHGILITRLGLWKSTLLGALLTSFGYIVSFVFISVIPLYFTLGFSVGFGTGLTFIASTTAIGMAFEGPQRVVALTIQNSSLTVTGISLPYFLNFLAETYGVSGTFLILGGICLNCIPGAIIFAILERQHSKVHVKLDYNKDGHSRNSCVEIAKRELTIIKQVVWSVLTLPYGFNGLGAGVTMASGIAFYSIMVDVLAWKGCTKSEALLSFTVASITGFAAGSLASFAKNCNPGQSLFVPTMYTLAGCCGFVLVFTFTSVPVILSGCGLVGIAVSGSLSASFIVVLQMLRQEQISVGIGLIMTAVGVSTTVLGPIFGTIRDSSNSYSGVLLLGCAIEFLGVCLYIAAIVTWRLSARISKRNNVIPHKDEPSTIFTTPTNNGLDNE